jgi:transposase
MEIVHKTTQCSLANATHWSTRSMATEMAVSEATVRRVWHANGLKPHLIETFKVSKDKRFAEKVDTIVGLYLNPPEHAIVLCVDEKSQIQALDRTQPGLPLKKGRGATMTHDYKRNGTATLFAALNTLEGTVIGMCQERHRHQEWLKFLRVIDDVTPAGKQIHLIADNYATHKHAKVQRWLKRRPRFHVYLAEYGRALLWRFNTESIAPRSVQRCRGIDHGNRELYRPAQRQPQTVHLDGQSKRHPGKGEARQESHE